MVAHFLLGVGVGFCAAAFIVRHPDPAPPQPCYLNVAYELGQLAGDELYAREALTQPPRQSRLAAEWQPDPDFTVSHDQSQCAQIAFAKGRHDGWWMGATDDVFDEACQALRESA